MATTPAPSTTLTPILPGLTGLRGVAALWVTSFHVAVISRTFAPTALPDRFAVLDRGWLGVDLFFLLSGFVLMHAHADRFRGSFLAATPRFLVARVWRVYPLNAAVLGLILLAVSTDQGFAESLRGAAGVDLSWSAFMRTLTLSTRWFGYAGGDWNTPVWSLSLELIGYAAFPIIACLAWRLQTRSHALAAALTPLAFLILLQYRSDTLDMAIIGGPLAFWRMACEFAAGVLLYRARMLATQGDARFATAIALLSVGWVAAMIAAGTATLASVGFAGLVWSLSFTPRDLVGRVFASRGALTLGRLSFPLYLIHGMGLQWTMSALRRSGIEQPIVASALLASGIAAILVVSWFVHLRIERPCARIATRIAHRREKGGDRIAAPPLAFGS